MNFSSMELTFSQRREVGNSGYNRPELHAASCSWVCTGDHGNTKKGEEEKNGQMRAFELGLKD